MDHEITKHNFIRKHPNHPIVPFSNVSNVSRSNRIIFGRIRDLFQIYDMQASPLFSVKIDGKEPTLIPPILSGHFLSNTLDVFSIADLNRWDEDFESEDQPYARGRSIWSTGFITTLTTGRLPRVTRFNWMVILLRERFNIAHYQICRDEDFLIIFVIQIRLITES